MTILNYEIIISFTVQFRKMAEDLDGGRYYKREEKF